MPWYRSPRTSVYGRYRRMMMRTYVGEVHFEDGTYTLVGNELQLEDHALITIEVDGKEQELMGFTTQDEAAKKTELLATLHSAKSWHVKWFDLELEEYCDFCGTHGHLEENCNENI